MGYETLLEQIKAVCAWNSDGIYLIFYCMYMYILQDYVILDEGHKIKNPTKTSKGVHMIAARHRIILTGTPIQNNLKVYILY